MASWLFSLNWLNLLIFLCHFPLYYYFSEAFRSPTSFLPPAFTSLLAASSQDLSLKLCSIISIPMALQASLIQICLILSSFFSSSQLDEGKFLKANRNVLSNTSMFTFLFTINLLSIGLQSQLPQEKLVLISLCFVCARLLYSLGYLLGLLLKSPILRIPGQGLTMIVLVTLASLNLSEFLTYINY